MTISIHPPRTGWDGALSRQKWHRDISIHPPRTGWDWRGSARRVCSASFQSTHPARGGTVEDTFGFDSKKFQSTHPARGGTMVMLYAGLRRGISIHPPRTGWDPWAIRASKPISTISIHPPRTGWDGGGGLRCDGVVISIHPPRTGWDDRGMKQKAVAENFNPPTPHGVGRDDERRRAIAGNFNPPTPHGVGQAFTSSQKGRKGFQSTHPARGGTCPSCAMLVLDF